MRLLSVWRSEGVDCGSRQRGMRGPDSLSAVCLIATAAAEAPLNKPSTRRANSTQRARRDAVAAMGGGGVRLLLWGGGMWLLSLGEIGCGVG